MNKIILGKWGEQKAKEYLINRNYFWVASNIRIHRGELDIIFKKSPKHLVIVEVKTKKCNISGEAAELVDRNKIHQIEYLTNILLNHKHLIKKYQLQHITSWQLDVIAIYGNGHQIFQLNHYENITIWD